MRRGPRSWLSRTETPWPLLARPPATGGMPSAVAEDAGRVRRWVLNSGCNASICSKLGCTLKNSGLLVAFCPGTNCVRVTLGRRPLFVRFELRCPQLVPRGNGGVLIRLHEFLRRSDAFHLRPSSPKAEKAFQLLGSIRLYLSADRFFHGVGLVHISNFATFSRRSPTAIGPQNLARLRRRAPMP